MINLSTLSNNLKLLGIGSYLLRQLSGRLTKVIAAIIVFCWIFSLFALFGPLKTFLLGVPLAGLGEGSFSELSNYAVWWQLAGKVAFGNILSNIQSIAGTNNVVNLYPYLTILVHGFLIFIFGVEATAWIGTLILPILCFLLLTLVYRRFVDWRWAICLAALGLFAFSNFPFGNFLLGLLEGKGWIDLGQSLHPDILQFPFPAFSLTVFTAVFLASIRYMKLTTVQLTTLSVLWALQAYVHILNAFVGITFWMIFIAVRLFRKNNYRYSSQYLRAMLFQAVLVLVIISPALIGYLGQFGDGLGVIREPATNGVVELGFLLGYLIFPLILMATLSRIQSIDLFELRTKFLPVWVLMASEAILLFVHSFFGIGPSVESFQSRLGMFFIHPFSFVPIIYYGSLPRPSFERPTKGSAFSLLAKKSLEWFFREASFVYLPIFYVLISLYAISSARQGYEDAAHVRNMAIFVSEAELSSVKSVPVEIGDIAVVQSVAGNLLLPVRTGFGSLLVPRFVDHRPESEAIERIALYAQLVGWSEEQFIDFMMPSPFGSLLLRDRITLADQSVRPGIGYWLVHHYTLMTIEDLARYRSRLLETFIGLNVPSSVKRYKVRVLVLSKGGLAINIPHHSLATDTGFIITID
jgi:hypothetical protein